jgi:hypothetical protein
MYTNLQRKLCRATNLSQSGEAADVVIHSCPLRCAIVRSVRRNGSQFMVVGTLFICSRNFVGMKAIKFYLKSGVDLHISLKKNGYK